MSRHLGPVTTLLCALAALAALAAPGCAGGRPELEDATLEPELQQQDAGPGLSFPDLGNRAVDGALPCANDETFTLGRCYLLLERPEGLSYKQARAVCKDRGSHVVTISTAQENAAALALLSNPLGAITHTSAGVWIGLRRSAPNSKAFVWESGQSLTFVNWAPGEPSDSNGDEDCVIIWRPGLSQAGRWNDAPCDSPGRGAVICARTP